MAVTRRTERLVKRALMWGATGVLALGAVLLAGSTWRVYTKMNIAQEERVHAEEERDQLVIRTKELAASLEALKTPRGVESQIRERYPVVKPGEVEFVMVDAPQTASSTQKIEPKSAWERLEAWLGF